MSTDIDILFVLKMHTSLKAIVVDKKFKLL